MGIGKLCEFTGNLIIIFFASLAVIEIAAEIEHLNTIVQLSCVMCIYVTGEGQYGKR